MTQTPTVVPTPDPTGVNSTPATPQGVNTAQATTQQIVDTSGLIASYEQRLRALMSEKDKAINERNTAISQLTENQKQLTDLQSQTQGSITAAANAAQQSIDRAKQLETDLVQERAKNVKLSALIQRPHLAAYEQLIPLEGDSEKMKLVLDQLETIRQNDLAQYAQAVPTPPAAPAPQTTPNILQSLYGNRANMNPAVFQSQTPVIPASSPASMSPNAQASPTQTVEAMFAEARRIGTQQAFEDAVAKAALYAKNAYNS